MNRYFEWGSSPAIGKRLPVGFVRTAGRRRGLCWYQGDRFCWIALRG